MQAIVLSDRNLDIVWTNQGMCRLVGKTLRELRGTSFLSFLHEPEHGALREALDRALENNTRVEHAATFTPPFGGAPKRILFKIDPVEDRESGDTVYRIAQGERVRLKRPREERTEANSDAMQRAYRFSNLTLSEGQRLFDTLDDRIDDDTLYLDAGFSIEEAAQLLHTNTTYVSQVVNFFTDHTFPAYINYKRVHFLLDYVREHPAEAKSDIWKKAGFGSYHAFYRFVKRAYGITPKTMFAESLKGADSGVDDGGGGGTMAAEVS